MEERLAARAGLAFETIETGQLRGRDPWTAARNLYRMFRGLRRSLRLVDSFDPDVVLVTGGYVCAPVVLAARWRGRPVLIYLPDLTPGLAIRWLSRLSQQVAVTCPEAARHFPGKALVSGYPVRQTLLRAAENRAAARRAFDLDPQEKTLLVFGGSRGARSINRALMACLPRLLPVCQVIHVSGHLDWPWMEEEAGKLPPPLRARYRPFAYLHEEMAQALAAADLVVSRAGAATLGEYTVLGLPSLLVPYPYAGRHQEANARYLANHGAAQILDDAALSERLLPMLLTLLNDETALKRMGERAHALARPQAAMRIAEALITLARTGGGRKARDQGRGSSVQNERNTRFLSGQSV